ncbi:hypothetical protein ACLKMH_20070 [Psychromonas sp. KJ10-10]|uniref:hypothetical protein n=1 Tax=Psychromonas sp. KJ10-10 TaxID=3391823 RepID=UPI0039B4A2BC
MTNENSSDDFSLFSAEFSGIKKLKQDTIKLPSKNIKKKQLIKEKAMLPLKLSIFLINLNHF